MTREIMDARAQVDDMAPMEQVCSAIDDEMFCFSVTTEYEGNVIYSDLPGRFPIESYAGMNYFFVAYIYKCNYIIIRPMKSRKDEDMVATFKDIYDELKAKGINAVAADQKQVHDEQIEQLGNEGAVATISPTQR